MPLESSLLCTQMERVRGHNDKLVETIYVFDIVRLRRERSEMPNGWCTPPCRQRVSWLVIQEWWGGSIATNRLAFLVVLICRQVLKFCMCRTIYDGRRIWFRETGLAVPPRVSLLILHTQAESGAYLRDSSRCPQQRPYIFTTTHHWVSPEFIGSRNCVPIAFTTESPLAQGQ